MSEAPSKSIAKPSRKESGLPGDHPQEVLRRALQEARDFGISFKRIIALCRTIRPKFKLSETSLRHFIDGTNATINYEKYGEHLAAFWVHSFQGRALRSLNKSTSPKFLEIIGFLASGRTSLNPKRSVDGSYFMYHGSYRDDNRYVVRVITIRSDDGGIFVVEDSINFKQSPTPTPLVAYGVMVFARENPQMFLSAEENKVGMCLFIANDSGVPTGPMTHALGDFFAMTANGDLVYRRALLRHQPDGKPVDMIPQSGTFTLQELMEPGREQHLAEFRTLAEHKPKKVFDDPLFKIIPKVKSHAM